MLEKVILFFFNSYMSGSLDWNRDIGISEDSQASTKPLKIQTCFSYKFICFHVILLSFHVNSKRFSQNQKSNRTKYFSKISWDFGVEPLRFTKKCREFHKEHSCDGWIFFGFAKTPKIKNTIPV